MPCDEWKDLRRVVTRQDLPAVLGSILRTLMAGRASRAAA